MKLTSKNIFSKVKSKQNIQRIATLIIYGLSVLGKFLIIFFLTKQKGIEFQGEFAVINTNIALLVSLIGFDLHIHSNMMVVVNQNRIYRHFKHQIVAYLPFYTFYLISLIVLSLLHYITGYQVVLFFFLGLFEHISLELMRIYIAVGRVVKAYTVFFFKSGLWSFGLISILLLNYNITINKIILMWTLSSFLAVVYGLYGLFDVKSLVKQKVNFKQILVLYRISSIYFLSTIFLKIIEFSERYFIYFFNSKKIIGTYSFYYQMSILVFMAISTSIISFVYKEVVSRSAKNDKSIFKYLINVNILIFILVLVAGIVLLFVLPKTISILKDESMLDYIYILFLQLITVFFNLISTSYYSILTTKKQNKYILKLSIGVSIFNILLSIILMKYYGIKGLLISSIFTSIIFLAGKYYKSKQLASKWK